MKVLEILNKKKKMLFFLSIKISNAFLGLITNIFIVKKLSTEDYGLYSIILTIIGFITTFGFSWTSGTMVYIGAKEKSQTGKTQKTFWSRNIIMGITFMLLAIIFIVFKEKIQFYIGLSDINNLIILWVLIKVIIDSLNTYFLAVNEQTKSASILVISKILFISCSIIFKYNIKSLIFLNVICDSFGLIYLYFVKGEDIGKPLFDKENFKEVFTFGIWQLFGFSGVYLINFGDNIIIKHYMEISDVGIYNSAYRLFNSIAALSTMFSSFYVAQFNRKIEDKNKKEIEKLFYKERVFLILVTILPQIILILFSKPLIYILYGKEYYGAIIVLQILLVGSIFKYISMFSRLIYNSFNKYRDLQIVNLIQMIINICLDIILIKKFGIVGAAIATTIAIVLTEIYKIIKSEKILKDFLKDIKMVKK